MLVGGISARYHSRERQTSWLSWPHCHAVNRSTRVGDFEVENLSRVPGTRDILSRESKTGVFPIRLQCTSLLLALLVGGCASEDPTQPERQLSKNEARELHALSGEWEVVACHIGGVAHDANVGARIQIREGMIRDHHGTQTIDYECEIDASTTPRRMTWNMVGSEVDGDIQHVPMAMPGAEGI